MHIKSNIINWSSKIFGGNAKNNFPLDYCLPVYHTVSNDDLPHLKHIIKYKNTKEFEKDLEQMLRVFQFVDWEEFKKYQSGKSKAHKKIALLTFDDGLREFYDVVIPILERKGIYAINFVNPKFIDNQGLMFRCKTSLLIEQLLHDKQVRKQISEYFQIKESQGSSIEKLKRITFQEQFILEDIAKEIDFSFEIFLKNQQPYLTLSQLNIIKEKGFGISAHGWDHPLYHDLTLENQLNNTYQSIDYVREQGFIAESFAFPFTDFGITTEFFDQLFNEKKLFCSFGSAGIKHDSFAKNFQRIPMETGENAEQILKKEVGYFQLKKWMNKNTIRRK